MCYKREEGGGEGGRCVIRGIVGGRRRGGREVCYKREEGRECYKREGERREVCYKRESERREEGREGGVL